MTTEPKIICIGLPKTGTSSLHLALQKLGYRSVHFPADSGTVAQLRRGDYRLRVLEENDAISDIPVPAVFPQLDRAFPGARFILTERALEPWIASERKAPFNSDPPKPGSVRDFYRAILYGVTEFSEERFRFVHEDFHARVDRYFADRPGDLLRLDVTAGQGWDRLCPFLGRPVPDEPFPRENVAPAAPPSRGRRRLTRLLGRIKAS